MDIGVPYLWWHRPLNNGYCTGRKTMRRRWLFAGVMLLGMNAVASQTDEDLRRARQDELDQACEAARQVALAPRRQEIYEECISRYGKDEAVCRNDANGYNGNRIGGAPLFYDLPECEEAFEYRRSN
jgi:hypothetical protein